MKAIEQYSQVELFLILYKVALTFTPGVAPTRKSHFDALT